MFFTFSQPQHVLNMFLNFWRFSASCSYKKGSYKKKRVYRGFNLIVARCHLARATSSYICLYSKQMLPAWHLTYIMTDGPQWRI